MSKLSKPAISKKPQLLTPIGTKAMGLSWTLVQKCFAIKDLNGQIENMQILAYTTGDIEIIEEFDNWKKTLDNDLKLKRSKQYGLSKMERYLDEEDTLTPVREQKHREIYKKLIQKLRDRNYLEFAPNTPVPALYNVPTG